MSTEGIAGAFASTRAVLENVKEGDLDHSTPCASWDVRRLINHIIGGAQWFAISTAAGSSPENDETEDTDYTTGDMLAAYDENVAAALAAFGAPGAQERMLTLPFGQMPGAAFMGLATMDNFVHGWDLARATGQDRAFDEQLAERLLAQAQMTVPDQFRGPDGAAPFGPKADVDDSAPAADRLAAFLGRHP